MCICFKKDKQLNKSHSLLILAGTNSSNYISQYLFDRWKDARHLPQQVHGTVRGLNNKLVHILCHFPFYNKVSESNKEQFQLLKLRL